MQKIALKTTLLGTLVLISLASFCQTPGLIFKSAGTGVTVLDPNRDGYTSISASGFISDDQSESEIPYKPLVVPSVEPVADPGPGPDCGFTDIVDSGDEDPVFSYYDANGNFLFRFRLGNAADNSKGYSILIDTDQKFGFSGVNADPNAVSGNPGFEIEIVLRTNFGVSLYSVDGTTTPVLKTTLSYDNYAQKSVALTTNCGNADYFYDFYIPFSTITNHFPSVTASTPLRMVAVTSMNPAPAIGNNAVSDVGGIDDSAYGYNLDNIFQTVVDNYTPTSATGTPQDRSVCPTITSPVANSATIVTGTSTEIGATIKVYKGNTEPLTLIGTTTVGAGGTWTATVSAVSTGDVISATAINTNEGESYYNCSQVTVTNCSVPALPYNLTRETNRKYISGIAYPGATIKVYTVSGGTYTQQSGSFALSSTGDGSFCWVPGINASTCTPPNGSGTLTNGTTYYVTQTSNGCESAKAPICVDNQVSANPTLTQTPVYTTTTTLSGTCGSNASITIYANGTSIATTTASGTSWSTTVNLSAQVGKYITVTAIEGSKCSATALTAGVIVSAALSTSATPVISGSYCGISSGSSATISGTSSEANGTTITLYINGVSSGTASVYNSSWSILSAVKGGDVLTATATAAGKNVSSVSSSVTVSTSGSAPSVTFNTPITEGASSISGSFTGTGTLKVYIDGLLLGSTTSNSFTISSLGVYDVYAGGSITASLTSTGCESAKTSGVIVQCTTPSTSLSVSAATATICSGETTSVTIQSSQSGIVYQLYNGASSTGISKLGTGGDITLTTGALTSSATIIVKALKISPISCASTLINSQTVIVTPVISGNTIAAPSITNFCQSGNPETIVGSTPTGGSGSYTYQWKSSTDNSTYSDISSATGISYDPGNLNQTTYFKRVITSGGCQSSSTVITITIQNTSLTNSISSNTSTSFNDNGVPNIDGNDSGGGATYLWQYSTDNNLFSNTSITTEDYTTGLITQTTYFRRVANNGSCSVISNVISYAVNHSPTAVNFSKSGLEDVSVIFAASDFTGAYSDSDGDALTQIKIESISPNGILKLGSTTLTAGSILTVVDLNVIVFTPAANYNGTTSFTWKGHDGQVYSSNTSTVTVNLSSVNDAPTFIKGANQSNLVNGGAISINGWATAISPGPIDEASQSLTFSISNNNTALFSIQPNVNATTGNLTYTIASNQTGTAILTLTLSDNGGSTNGGDDTSSPQTFTITVSTIANQVPVANDATVSINENAANGTAIHTVIASDADGNTLTYAITAGNSSGAFAINAAGAITVADQSKLDYETVPQFILTVNASDGSTSDDATITINLNNLNDNSPNANDAAISINENSTNGTAVHTVAASDADGDALTYSITAGNTSGAFSINASTGAITIADQSKLDYETTTQFALTVNVSDGNNSDDATITINLNNLNDNSPIANDATVSINENAANGSAVHTVVASDADGNILTYSITAGNSSGAFTINPSTGAIMVADQSDYEITTQFALTVNVSDGNNSDDATITINLNNLNDNLPNANDATVSINENAANGTAVHTVVASDADGNILTYSITAGNSSGTFTINPSTGAIMVADQSRLDYETVTQFVLTVSVSDGVNSDDALITINLNNLNDNSPVANDATVSINENSANGTAVHTVAASDADGNTLTYSITGGNSLGAFLINSSTGAITVADQSKLDYETTTQFTLTVNISDGATSANATITINLIDLNDSSPTTPVVASTVTSTITAATTTLTADGISTTTITVQLKDAAGNNLTHGGDQVNLQTTTGTFTSIVDNGDGTYTAILKSSVTPTTATITGNVNGSAITDKEIVKFVPGPASPLTSVITASASSITADGVSTTTLTVQLKDANGNLITTGGNSVKLNSTLGTITSVVDNGNGTYTATLVSSSTAGTSTITGTVNDQPIVDSESVVFTPVPVVTILTATISADHSKIPADGTSSVVITISVKDQNNQPITRASINVSTTLGALGNIADNQDGTYTVVLTSSSDAGTAVVTFTLNGQVNDSFIAVTFEKVIPRLFIPEGFSPDGDGINDTFVIEGIENKNVTLHVFNRWGDKVYEASTYKNDWDGLANYGVVIGNRLPDGTYFYVVDLNEGDKPFVRFMTIKRK